MQDHIVSSNNLSVGYGRDAVLSGQNADGSFRKNDVGYVSGMSNKSENIYRQCLATLMLETYYRFLPGTGEGTKNS